MKKILNIYNKATGGEVLGSVFTVEEFLQVKFNTWKYPQAFTYSEYIDRVKTQTKNGYFFKDARGKNSGQHTAFCELERLEIYYLKNGQGL